MSRFDLVELERTHERRSRRMTAADRAPGPLVGSAVARDVEAAREAIAVVVERAEPHRVTLGTAVSHPSPEPRSTYTDLASTTTWPPPVIDRGHDTVSVAPRTEQFRRHSFTGSPGFLRDCIRGVLDRSGQPMTSQEIARAVLRSHPNRWGFDTVRRACGKARLFELDRDGLSDQNCPCVRYLLEAPS